MIQSLRGRLLAGLIAVVLAGLVVSASATYLLLQSFLLQRVNQQLLDGRTTIEAYLTGGGYPGREQGPEFPPGTYAELLSPSGRLIQYAVVGGVEISKAARPDLPGSIPTSGPNEPNFFTTSGHGGVDSYAVLSQRLDSPLAPGYVMVFALPLNEVQSTLDRLLLLEASVGAALLLVLGFVSWLIVRVGLRPLERIGRSAEAIAVGDLGRRVEPATPSTEIGRLGLSLNAMLAQIEQAFAESKKSEDRLRRFVADASHELRTPLTSIRGYAEILRRRPPPSARDAALAKRRIEQEAVRMSVLVDDLLLLARLDQGRPLDQAPVDLTAIAEDACADALVAAPDRAVTLDSPGQVVVLGDEERLRQVIGNLVRNAIVHTPAGSPVEVQVGSDTEVATLAVVDHGQGLTADQAERVFEPFYRTDAGRSRDRGGAGLGLSIVAAVVAAHGGEVGIEPTPGGGATFRVGLPLGGTSHPTSGVWGQGATSSQEAERPDVAGGDQVAAGRGQMGQTPAAIDRE